MIALVHEQLLDDNGTQYDKVYSKTLAVGDMSRTSSVAHPWMNGTQFIGCAWGANGVSGGCQVRFNGRSVFLFSRGVQDVADASRTCSPSPLPNSRKKPTRQTTAPAASPAFASHG
jgi:hypothetical protein